ncbi:hypothetical protein EYF80_029209 [Liparis tanakae]|uniref:Uncharacterized protein n=1 Tax=Liparis tanakae TaxID=230148 RepID=A0A4Z2H432_9TELE|nr:hypothetical protein EYF80_029209 [Liparis tanakae]
MPSGMEMCFWCVGLLYQRSPVGGGNLGRLSLTEWSYCSLEVPGWIPDVPIVEVSSSKTLNPQLLPRRFTAP